MKNYLWRCVDRRLRSLGKKKFNNFQRVRKIELIQSHSNNGTACRVERQKFSFKKQIKGNLFNFEINLFSFLNCLFVSLLLSISLKQQIVFHVPSNYYWYNMFNITLDTLKLSYNSYKIIFLSYISSLSLEFISHLFPILIIQSALTNS